jgi:signal transduction histidine kinase
MTTKITAEFEQEITHFLSDIQLISELQISSSQIWSLDSQGFHIIWQGNETKSAFREIARQACIQNQAILDDTIAAFPFRFNEKHSGAISFRFEQSCSLELFEVIEQSIQDKLQILDVIMSSERLARISGSSKRADWLGKALSLAYEIEYSDNVAEQYAQIHDALNHLMFAKNFFVMTLDSSGKNLAFDYKEDEYDNYSPILPIREGLLQGSLSAYVVKSRKVIRGPSIELAKEVMGFEKTEEVSYETKLSEYGVDAYDWIGVPLVIGQDVFGAMVIQSYDENIKFDEQAPTLLAAVAEAIASSLQRKKVRKELEEQVFQRTAELADSNSQLALAVTQLKLAQKQLIETEKQASLGRLVSGIAHELNTPLGISITANSLIEDNIHGFVNKFESNSLTKTGISTFLESMLSSGKLLSSNLNKTGALIERFKEIATSQQSDSISRFNLKVLIDEIIFSQRSAQVDLGYTLKITCTNKLKVNSYPNLIKRIIFQLIENSVKHAFLGQADGQISINFQQVRDMIVIQYCDNGVGVDSEFSKTIFDPFITTDRFGGSVGIGLHIVSNIVTQRLKGAIKINDKPACGFMLEITFPYDVTQIKKEM